ncbi:MAG: bactofilin family protein [Bacteroidota bacterium]
MARTNTSDELNFIAGGTIIEGKISTLGSLRIDGKVKGNITVGEGIAVGATGEVEGTLAAKNVTIGGKIVGNITAAEKLTLEQHARVRGDIRAAVLIVDEGAIFDGNCSMSKEPEQVTQGEITKEKESRRHATKGL